MIDRSVAPPFQEPTYFTVQEANSEILSGGIPFHIVNAGEQELVRIEIIFKAGKWYETTNAQSFLTAKLLTEGTKSYTSNEVSVLFERNGAFYEISPGLDFISFNVYCLNKNVSKILPLIDEIICAPTFPTDELETAKNLQVQSLKVNLEKTSYMASRIFREKLFGKDHPYGRKTEIEDIQNIRQSDLISYFREKVENNFEVIVSGRIDDHLLITLKDFFSKYDVRRYSPPLFNGFDPQKEKLNIDNDEKLQTSLRIGKKTLAKSHRDYFYLLIFNEILGGYFGSRLMQKLREEKGYTYGIHSSVISLVYGSYFQISSDIIKKNKDDALNSIYNEIEQLIRNPVPESELKTVVNYFKGVFLSSINSPFSLADKFKGIHFHNLTYTYYKQLFRTVDSVTPQKLQKFIQDNFACEELVEVTVG